MTSTVYPEVTLGSDPAIGEFCIIGLPAERDKRNIPPTRIGNGSVIRSHTVIYAGTTIGHRFQTGHHVLIRERNVIGDNVSIGSSTVVEHTVHIGNGVRIHSQAFIPEFSILEEGCWIGPRVVITNALYPQSQKVKSELKGAHILRGAIVGANATLLPGIVIGERAIVGAGAVVTQDVPAGKVVAGNPARIINDISNLPY